MVSITDMATDLMQQVSWQQTPYQLQLSDYESLIMRAFEYLFIQTGRTESFNTFLVEDDGEIFYDADILIDEKHFIMLCAQIFFFNRVKTDYNTRVSYTTNALSVTGGDKPYAHIKQTVDELKEDLEHVKFKLTRFNLGN